MDGQISHSGEHTSDLSWLLSDKGSWRRRKAISLSAVDAGSDPVTTLRAGLVVGKVTAGGSIMQYDDANNPAGIGVAVGILVEEVVLLDQFGNPLDQAFGSILLPGAWIDADKTFGIDAAGKADLRTAGFFLIEDY